MPPSRDASRTRTKKEEKISIEDDEGTNTSKMHRMKLVSALLRGCPGAPALAQLTVFVFSVVLAAFAFADQYNNVTSSIAAWLGLSLILFVLAGVGALAHTGCLLKSCFQAAPKDAAGDSVVLLFWRIVSVVQNGAAFLFYAANSLLGLLALVQAVVYYDYNKGDVYAKNAFGVQVTANDHTKYNLLFTLQLNAAFSFVLFSLAFFSRCVSTLATTFLGEETPAKQ